jgi:hypothetical protein
LFRVGNIMSAGQVRNSDDRDGRLRAGGGSSLRKNNEEVLRKVLQAEAREKCMSFTKAFGDCAKEASIMVVFKCRDENRAMQDCLSREYNEEKFAQFLQSQGLPPAAKSYSLADRFGDMFK